MSDDHDAETRKRPNGKRESEFEQRREDAWENALRGAEVEALR